MDEPAALKLREALESGATDLARNVRSWVAACILDGAEPEPSFIELFGEETANQLWRCRKSIADNKEGMEHLSAQIGRVLSYLLNNHSLARPVFVDVGADGNKLSCDGEEISLRGIGRFADWHNRPVDSTGIHQEAIELARCVSLNAAIGQALTGFRHIAASEAFREIGPEMDLASWYISGAGHTLELFFRDCLNRCGLVSRLAPFHEDVLEATDLRVRIPDTNRKKGTRVQVSWLSTHEMFRKKRHLIAYHPTVVMLCPFTLVQEWRWREDIALSENYSASPQKDADEEAAGRLRDRISTCIREHERAPLGPSKFAGADLLKLISEFVTREGTRANLILRERQETRPSYGSSHEYVRAMMIRDLRERYEVANS